MIYAIALILFAYAYAGETWGLGKWWRNLPIVQKYQWLR